MPEECGWNVKESKEPRNHIDQEVPNWFKEIDPDPVSDVNKNTEYWPDDILPHPVVDDHDNLIYEVLDADKVEYYCVHYKEECSIDDCNNKGDPGRDEIKNSFPLDGS